VGQRAEDGSARKLDLERVAPETLGLAQHEIGRLRESRRIGGLPAQRRFGLQIAPGLVGDAAERETGFLDGSTFELEPDGDGYESERVGEAIANLEISVVGRESAGRELDRRDDLTRLEIAVALRSIPWQPMEIGKRDDALARGAGHMDLRLKDGERHAHVG